MPFLGMLSEHPGLWAYDLSETKVPSLNCSSSFLNHCTSTSSSPVELCILEVALFLLILHDTLFCFGTESEQSFSFMFYSLLNISVCELRISLLLSLKFSIDEQNYYLT